MSFLIFLSNSLSKRLTTNDTFRHKFEWHSLRRKVAPHILKQRAAASHIDAISLITDNFIDLLKLQRNSSTKTIKDISQYLFRFTFEGIFI